MSLSPTDEESEESSHETERKEAMATRNNSNRWRKRESILLRGFSDMVRQNQLNRKENWKSGKEKAASNCDLLE
jgi:hypothetical protein